MRLQEDRIIEFEDRCAAVGIRNPVDFLVSKMPVVFDYLKGAFPRGILPTDIDGEVEVNRRFLRLEFKQESRLRNGAIPKGQMMLFERLVETGVFTVFLVGFDCDGVPTCLQVYAHGKKPSRLIEASREVIHDYCARWATWADKQTSNSK